MAITLEGSGSQTATVTTEHTLLDVAVVGTYTFHIDCINMAAADVVELRIYTIVLTAGTRRVTYFQVYQDAQVADDLIKISVPVSNDLTDAGAIRFTLKQTLGTGRVFPWKVLKY